MRIVILLVLLFSLSSAISITGEAFEWTTLSPFEGALIRVFKVENGEQLLVTQVISDDLGYYSVDVDQGRYYMTATGKNGSISYSSDSPTILLESDTVIDFPLIEEFPEIEDIKEFPEIISVIGEETLVQEEVLDTKQPQGDFSSLFSVLALLAVVLVIALIYFKKDIFKDKVNLSAGDDHKVLNILQREGKSLQSDIVKGTGFSEAKVSLIIKDLQKRKKVTKEKVGRTNVIRLLE